MKNSHLLIGSILVLGSSAAAAQSSVQLYGVADAAITASSRGDVIQSTSGTPPVTTRTSAGNAFGVASGVQSASRFGIRGTEDLGSGLKALFAAEAAWNVDEGTGASAGALNFQRRSVVGLGGSFGSILLGRDYTPAFYAGQATDVFSYGLYGTSYVYQNSGGYTNRASNGIHYTTPSWGGLTLRVSAGSSERYEAPKSRGHFAGLSLVYKSGPITGSAYYQQVNLTTAATANAVDKQKQFGVGGGYDFGFARILAGWGRSDNPDVASGASTNFDSWNVGAGVRAGPGELLISYTNLKSGAGRTASLGGTAGTQATGKVWGVAYTYPLSKRTNLYANYGQTNNSAGGAFGLSANGTSIAAGAPGEKVRAVALGVRHQF